VEHAFYEPAGQARYVATPATEGPWSPGAQHGGPPSALAAQVLRRHEPDETLRLSRVAVDILRPVPVGKLVVRARTVRRGRRVALAEAVMEAGDVEVLHARGWFIQRADGQVPEVGTDRRPGPVPAAGAGWPPRMIQAEPTGYLASIDWRFSPADCAGAAAVSPGSAWTRPRIPLIAGEEPVPMARALLVADSGSGVGAVLPARRFLFINVDLTVTLTRDPVGEWLLLEPATAIGSAGTGLTTTRLSDEAGEVGHGAQTLLVTPR